MKTLLKSILVLVLVSQHFANYAVAKTSNEVICTGCIPEGTDVGDTVDVGGDRVKITGKGTVKGRPTYTGVSVGSGAGSNVHEAPPGVHSAVGEGRGVNETGGNRFTGKDFSDFEDDKHSSKSDREKIARNQALIVDRINRETAADSEATSGDLKALTEKLTYEVNFAAASASSGTSSSIPVRDPMTAIAESLGSEEADGDLTGYLAGWNYYDNYNFQSDRAQVLEGMRNRLNVTPPKSPQQVAAGRTGYLVLVEADNAFLNNDTEEGNALVDIGDLLIDFATDLNPITSIPKDAYRAYTGRDPITGELLADWERILAVGLIIATVATAGSSNTLSASGRAAGRVARLSGAELGSAVKVGSDVVDFLASQRFLKATKQRLTDITYLDPVRKNQILKEVRKYTEKAWAESRMMVRGRTVNKETFVRVYGDDAREVGSWVADAKVIEGKTPAEIQKTMGLKNVPKMVSVVKVPAGAEVYTGFFSPNAFGGKVDSIQIFLPKAAPEWFGEGKAIGNVYQGLK